jgi:hypothetical protein
MLNLFGNQPTDEDRIEILLSTCAQIYENSHKSLSSSIRIPKKNIRHKSFRTEICKEALFTLIFLCTSRMYIENSQYKFREEIMGGVIRKIYYELWRLKDLDRGMINTSLGNAYKEETFEKLRRYQTSPEFNMPLVDLFIKKVFQKKGRLSRVKLNRELGKITRGCKWHMKHNLSIQNF